MYTGHPTAEIPKLFLDAEDEIRKSEEIFRNLKLLTLVDILGETVLHYAVKFCSARAAELLVQADSEKELLRIVNKDQNTAMHLAVQMHLLRMAELFCNSYDYDVGLNKDRETPFLIALRQTAYHSEGVTSRNIVRMMLVKNRNRATEQLGSRGWTALHHAAYYNNTDAIDILIRYCPDCIKVVNYASNKVCDDQHSDLIPCLDRHLIYQSRLKLDLNLMEHYERHCPQSERRFNCLIPPPPGYKVPIKWPKSRDETWKANVPHTHLASEKSDQRWMIVKGEKIAFPGGGTHFHYGADKYIASLANMLNFPNNNLNNQGKIRTVLDVGCGVASFGAYLLSSDIITMSLAPNDVHQNQIQFALERGIPAYLGVLGTKRLPYPSRSFQFAHCSRCRIDWLQRDGLLLLELDRLLGPGGYFAYSSPEIYAQDEENLKIGKEISNLVERMCWKVASKQNQTVIWVKPLTNDCYHEREPGTQPPLCRNDDDPDATWGVPMEACITPYSEQVQSAGGSGLVPWPARSTAPPPRLEDLSYSTDFFEKDTELWQERVKGYWDLLNPKIKPNTIRNIMDMKANLGSFAAALKDKDVWVMNVVPQDGPNTLKIVYDRGLIGTHHDWCEAFSTYPRTYDLLHAWSVFSDIEKKGCSPEDLMLEMDRMLRPTGFIIVRDKRPVMEYIKKYLSALHWDAIATADTESSSEEGEDEVVFVIRKRMWPTTENLRDST